MQKSNAKEFLLYIIVGGIATVSEWIVFFILGKCFVHYAVATVIAYILSTFVNWFVGRVLVFKSNELPFLKEIASIYLASIIGLLLNLLIMWVTVDVLSFNQMCSKIAATAIVFFYNFLVRKLMIYKQK
ncbi:MAG: GtrA family protein [Clostridia bacterium]|nr:GtrA family protein [Clostridia bacterium]